MKILSAASVPEGAFIIVEDDAGKAFIYFEAQHGWHVFSTEEDSRKVDQVHTFVREMFEQGAARAQSATNGGAGQEARDVGPITEVINAER